MERILFVTKYIDRERFFEALFRQLGHEVFLSDQFLNQLVKQPKTASLTEFFKIIVLSDTLTNQEVTFLLNYFQNQELTIFRKVGKEPTEEERQFWSERGICEWLTADMIIEDLREKLAAYTNSSEDNVCFSNEMVEKRSLSSLALNSTQLRFLQILYQEPNRGVTRDKMCELLWNRPSNASNLSQLSCLVKLLRKKLSNQGIEGESIITVWGQGYKLSDDFFKQITAEMKGFN